MERVELPPTPEELLELFEQTLERIAARGCRMSFVNRPRGTTCLDQQDEAAKDESSYAADLREKVLALDYPCAPCQARAALEARI